MDDCGRRPATYLDSSARDTVHTASMRYEQRHSDARDPMITAWAAKLDGTMIYRAVLHELKLHNATKIQHILCFSKRPKTHFILYERASSKLCPRFVTSRTPLKRGRGQERGGKRRREEGSEQALLFLHQVLCICYNGFPQFGCGAAEVNSTDLRNHYCTAQLISRCVPCIR